MSRIENGFRARRDGERPNRSNISRRAAARGRQTDKWLKLLPRRLELKRLRIGHAGKSRVAIGRVREIARAVAGSIAAKPDDWLARTHEKHKALGHDGLAVRPFE